jgi:hypothetical protein
MACSCKIAQISLAVGTTLVLQISVVDNVGASVDLTDGWVAKMQCRSQAGTVLFEAVSTGDNPTIELENDGVLTVNVLVPGDIVPQLANYSISTERDSIVETLLEGEIQLKKNFTEI